ncbi:MAG: LytTR family transcriptional regulator, partial [Lachnospiraceae bacterium]|nr:LytTR family transcriptional regulator [Lachnospiraceae bacterium]
MKLTMNKILQGEDEVIIRYREMNEQIEMLAALVEGKAPRVSA